MEHYAGLDLSMETTEVCVVDEKGRKVFATSVRTTPEGIASALSQGEPIANADIETGRMSASICLGLRRLGVNVMCIDARQAHQSLKAMEANKTDAHDAAGLAQLARTGFYKAVHVKSAPAQGVRSIIAARAHLVQERVRLDNTIRGLCVAFGIKVDPGQGKDFVARASPADRVPKLRDAVASLIAVRETLVERIRDLDCLFGEIGKTSTACQILMSIPGVGVQTAAFAATVDDADRFKRSRSTGAYFGLVPMRHQSGEVDWVGQITKQGDAMVRKLLYEAANSILTRAQDLCPEKMGTEDRAPTRARKGPCCARPASCCDHARHAPRWDFVRSMR